MKQAASKTTHTPRDNDLPLAGTLGIDALDTAWRVAVPIIVAASLGIFADRHFGTGPWITLAATTFGFVITALLIKRQLAALEREDTKSK